MPSVSELKAQAKARGLPGYSRMRKAELEKLLKGGKVALGKSKAEKELDKSLDERKLLRDIWNNSNTKNMAEGKQRRDKMTKNDLNKFLRNKRFDMETSIYSNSQRFYKVNEDGLKGNTESKRSIMIEEKRHGQKDLLDLTLNGRQKASEAINVMLGTFKNVK